MEPTDTASKSTSHRHKKALYKSGGKNEIEIRFKFGAFVTLKEQDPEATVVYG